MECGLVVEYLLYITSIITRKIVRFVQINGVEGILKLLDNKEMKQTINFFALHTADLGFNSNILYGSLCTSRIICEHRTRNKP